MRRTNALLVMCTLALAPVGVVACGSSDDNGAAIDAAEKRQQEIEQQLKQQGQQARQQLQRAQHKAAAAERKARKAAKAKAEAAAEAAASAAAAAEPEPEPASECDPNYSGCVPVYPPDVDCADVGTSVSVTGSDPHGLDADSDGIGCE